MIGLTLWHFFCKHRVILIWQDKNVWFSRTIAGLSFGHFFGNHRLVDLPDYWGFLNFPWVFGQLLEKYWQLRLKSELGQILLIILGIPNILKYCIWPQIPNTFNIIVFDPKYQILKLVKYYFKYCQIFFF